ncbi:cell envelope integrity protein TolA [Methylopila sp. M107]|uniref:cell envelope integrity protein TolA n=1 Tax=Methylopila sp. M107 TaxID=1101190 RepID=UPI00036EC55E|nr:cell envelope integrity protein TolA [Methylopila sp. M107]
MKDRAGLLLSSTFHAAILAYAFIGLGSAKPFEVSPESLPVEILSPEQFEAMTKGSKTSKKVDAPQQKTEQLAAEDSDPVEDDAPIAKEDVKAPPPPPPPAATAEALPKPEPKQDAAKAEAEKAAKAEAEKAAKAEAAKVAKAEAAKAEAEKAEKAEAAKAAKAEAAKAEAAKAEAAKVAQERAEKIAEAADAERRAKAAEEEKVAKAEAAAKAAKEKAEADKAAKEKAEKIAKAEADKAAKEKAEAEKAAKLAQEKADKEKLEKIAKAEAEKAAKAEADKLAKAEAAAKAAKDKADAEKAAKAAERKFDPSKIASLLGDRASSSDSALKDVRDPGRKAASGRQLAPETTAGTSRGTATKLSLSDQGKIKGAIIEQMKQCWNPPIGASQDGALVVSVKFTLNADGTLSGGPTVTNSSSNPAFRAAADAAMRAVRRCTMETAPLKLPADAYEFWRAVNINFDPKDMMGG